MSDEGTDRLVFGATIDGQGNLKPDAANETRGRLSRFIPKRDRHVTVTVTRYVKPKTNPQLAFYFGVVVPAWSEFTGYDPDEMDYELRKAWLAPQLAVSKLTGEETTERPRIRFLNAEEMRTYIDRCMREGQQVGVFFPEERAS